MWPSIDVLLSLRETYVVVFFVSLFLLPLHVCLFCVCFFFFLFTQRKSRDRQETNVKPITEFRQFHQVVAIAPLVLKVKRLACFCTACRDNHTDLCQNRDYTGMYKVYIMKQVIAPKEEEESIAP